MKRSCIFLSLLVLLISLIGCKSNAGNNSGDPNNEVYYSTNRTATVDMDFVLDFSRHEDMLILTGFNQKNYGLTVNAAFFDLDGNLTGESVLTLPSDDLTRTPSASDIDDEGNIWVLFSNYTYDEEIGYEYQNSSLECFDRFGNHIKNISLGMFDTDTLFSMDIIIGDGLFYISSVGHIRGFTAVFDENGTLLFELDRIFGICELSDGRVIVKRADIVDERASFFEVDTMSGRLGAEYKLEAEINAWTYYSGSGVDEMLETTPSELYVHNIDTKTRTMLFEWLSLGINPAANLHRFVVLADDGIFCLNAVTGNRIALMLITQSDTPSETGEKIVLNLAVMSDSSSVRETVAQFSVDNPNVEIQIKTYENYQDIRAALNALNVDIASGNIPDIMLISPAIPYESYVAKGLFVDLYELMDNDSDISREDFIPSVLSSLETEGKLYNIPILFSVHTVVSKPTDVELGASWTWDDFHALMKSKPSGTIPFSNERSAMSMEEFFSTVFYYSSFEFIDYGAGECYFDTPGFISLLETAKHYYPNTADYGITAADFRNGNPLMMAATIGSFGFFHSTRFEAYLGEDYFFIGYPTQTGSGGSYLTYYDQVAISSFSENKDIAWDYLKYVLTDYQYNDYDSENPMLMKGFPVSIAAFEKFAEESTVIGTHIGNRIEGYDIRFPEKRDIDKIRELVYSLDSYEVSISYISPIVMESAADYFAGIRTAQEAAQIIQSRVSVLLSERSW